jgi:DNA phosphorothioation-dependent restriction protein DptF
MATAVDSSHTESLFDLLRACQRGQRVAIVGGHAEDTDNQLQNELYVRQEDDKKVDSFFETEYKTDGKLLILTGSAGDGKTALLTRGYEAHDGELPQSRVNLDATEARRRDGDYVDRLSDFFDEVIEDIQSESGHRSAIAINYGLAVDYFERRDTPERHRVVWDAMQKQSSPGESASDGEENIKVINLSYRRTYDTHPDQLGEGLVRDLLDRFDPTNDQSPFTDAYEYEKEHCPAGDDCVLLYNSRQLTQTQVKDQLARLMAGWSISTGAYLNPRTIIDNIASLLLPPKLRELPGHEICPVGHAIEEEGLQPTAENLIWNATFKTLETDDDSNASHLDPASYTDFSTDQRALRWASDDQELAEKMRNLPRVKYGEERPFGKIRTYLRKEYLEKEGGRTIRL